MDLNEAMRCAPTSRLFTDEPVDVELLRGVFENARFAPSGGNRQGWRVIVVRDAESRRAIRDLYVPRWDAYQEQNGRAEMLRNPPDGIDPARLRMAQRADHYARHLDDVPVHLLVVVQLADLLVTDAELPRQSVVGGASVYPFVQNVLLGLRAAGLGAALTTLLVPAEAEVKRLLEIPDGFALVAHIGVGHRAEEWPKRLARKPVEEFAFGERFGQPLA
ncbi:MAG TPA: nitroreductase family protein [Solirubrobacteraceae bacterium]|jgi:nitroreductase|nr:nitroreductase family protein [Solirubrobacteraceae bacterium]